jgi:bifunctional non-homologous end joining protein LigD
MPRRSAAQQSIQVAGVTLTNPDRALYPHQGVTKRQLASYYAGIAEHMLPRIADRPLSLVRCPRGIGQHCFYQKHVTGTVPPGIDFTPITEKSETRQYVVLNQRQGIVGLAQLGVLEIHPWGSRTRHLERPDRLIFDMDPGPDVPWPAVIDATRQMRDLLARIGLTSFVMTTGGKGLHVVLPLQPRADWDQAKALAQGVSQQMVRMNRRRYVSVMTKSKRQGRIFIDYLRNGRGATAVAPYSPRARPGAPVATPLRWDELDRLQSPDPYTIDNLPHRLAALHQDPWAGYDHIPQSLATHTGQAG